MGGTGTYVDTSVTANTTLSTTADKQLQQVQLHPLERCMVNMNCLHCSLCLHDYMNGPNAPHMNPETFFFPCRVEAALQHWFVTGLQQQGVLPSLMTSVGDSSSSLLSLVFELNPEENSADQLLRVHSQPVEIVYDAVTTTSRHVTDVKDVCQVKLKCVSCGLSCSSR